MKLEELRALREKLKEEMNLRKGDVKFEIIVGMGTAGIAAGAREVFNKFVDVLKEKKIKDAVVKQSAEKGFSSFEPVVEIIEKGKDKVVYGNITEDKVEEIIVNHIIEGKVLHKYLISGK